MNNFNKVFKEAEGLSHRLFEDGSLESFSIDLSSTRRNEITIHFVAKKEPVALLPALTHEPTHEDRAELSPLQQALEDTKFQFVDIIEKQLITWLKAYRFIPDYKVDFGPRTPLGENIVHFTIQPFYTHNRWDALSEEKKEELRIIADAS